MTYYIFNFEYINAKTQRKIKRKGRNEKKLTDSIFFLSELCETPSVLGGKISMLKETTKCTKEALRTQY